MAGKSYGTAAYTSALTHPPGTHAHWKENEAWQEGFNGVPATGNPHAVGSVDAAAWDAGAASGDPHEAGRSTGVFAPIVGGYNFTGATNDYASSGATIDPNAPLTFSIQFKPDSLATAAKSLIHIAATNQFRVRLNITTGAVQIQQGGNGSGCTATLYNITDKTTTIETPTLSGLTTLTMAAAINKEYRLDIVITGTAGASAGTAFIGSNGDGSAANFDGVIANVKFGAGSTFDHVWKFDEGSGSTANDSVGSNNMTINAGSGSWA